MEQGIEIAAKLRSWRGRPSIEEILEWGNTVIDEIYDGDPEAWRSSETVTLRDLAAEAQVSVSTLYRYVAVTTMWRTCGEPRIRHLGISHLRELLPLHATTQRDLMERAEEEEWTVAKMRRMASLHQRRPESAGRGRPPQNPGYLRALNYIQSWVETKSRLEGLEHAANICEAEARSLVETLQVARRELALVEMRLSEQELT